MAPLPAQSDVYSLGVVFIELTGVEVRTKWILKLKMRAKSFANYLNPEFLDFNESVIARMTEYRPENRADLSAIEQ